MSGADWEWWSEDGEDAVVVPAQLAVAVYVNQKGQIVIRQEADCTTDEDTLVFLHKSHAEAVARAILNAAGDE